MVWQRIKPLNVDEINQTFPLIVDATNTGSNGIRLYHISNTRSNALIHYYTDSGRAVDKIPPLVKSKKNKKITHEYNLLDRLIQSVEIKYRNKLGQLKKLYKKYNRINYNLNYDQIEDEHYLMSTPIGRKYLFKCAVAITWQKYKDIYIVSQNLYRPASKKIPFTYNKYSVLPIEPLTKYRKELIEQENEDLMRPKTVKRIKKEEIDFNEFLKISCPIEIIEKQKRKLPKKITIKQYKDQLVHHQMEDSSHGQATASVNCSQNQNTIFLDETKPSLGATSKKLKPSIISKSHADTNHNMPIASEREIPVTNFQWGSESKNTKLTELIFPACILDKLSSTPNAMPFKMSTFFNSDLQINVRINSNKFQCGQLQCSWLYDTYADKNIDYRTNIYTLSQTTHCLINAGSSNLGTLNIPYISTYSSLPTIVQGNIKNCLNLGTLYIYVLNPLKSPDPVASTCDIAVSVVLKNPNFYGLKDISVGDFIYPQMMEGTVAAVMGAEMLLNTIKDSNRDNPPYQGPASKVVVMSNQSFSLGDQLVEPINALRLDARGQHIPVVGGQDEMSVNYIKSIYGLVKTFPWSSDTKSGQLLISFDASPVWNPDDYVGFKILSDEFKYIPPVAVLSSLFSYWSGELKLRFDIIANQFHTGRLMVVYVPYYQETISYEQAKSYPYEIFDLREHQQFVFNIPYVSNVPCYPRRCGFTNPYDKIVPPGHVHVFVYNSLIPMDNIAKSIDINVYLAGGDSFELFVPSQPSIATCFYASDDKPNEKITAEVGYYPWYFGNDNQFVDNDEVEHVICRYGVYWNDLTFFDNLKENCYYYMNSDSAKSNQSVVYVFGEGSMSIANLFYVPVDVDDGYGRVYLSACKSEASAIQYWKDGWKGAGRKQCLTIKNLTSAPYCVGNPVFNEKQVPNSNRVRTRSHDFEEIHHQMDERKTNNAEEQLTTDCRVYAVDPRIAYQVFGEKFDSLRVLCRRYQPYGVARGQTSASYGDVLFSIPIIPSGLDLNLADQESLKVLKKIRDGTIPIILSGYRFCSGGLRFAMVSSSGDKVYWVQHRPDYEGPAKITKPTAGSVADSLINSGYASYLQSAFVNNVLHFEVPYYKNRPLLYLQRPQPSAVQVSGAQHLGQLMIGAEGGKASQNIACSLFYSIADDFEAHTFQGFPAMLFLDEIQIPSAFSGLRTVERTAEEVYKVYPQVDLNVKLPDNLTDTIDKVNSLIDSLPQVVASAKDNIKEVLSSILSQLGHVIINPTIRTICWALVSVLVQLKIVTSNILTSLYNNIKTFFIHWFIGPDVSPEHVNEDTPVDQIKFCTQGTTQSIVDKVQLFKFGVSNDIIYPQNEQVDVVFSNGSSIFIRDAITIITQIIMTLSVILSFKTMPPKPRGVFSLAQSFIKSVANAGRDIKGVTAFITAFFDLLKKIVNYITLYKNPDKVFEHMATCELPLLSEWYEECREICDLKNEDFIFGTNSAWADRLEQAYNYGLTISINLMRYNENLDSVKKTTFFPVYSAFKDMFSEITLKRNNMLIRGNSTVSRREPFGIYLAGSSGIGKSVIASFMIEDLLDDAGIQCKGEKIYTLPGGSKWWNGCKNQPAILIDDFLALDSGEPRELDLRNYTLIKSCAILNPPQAAVDEKQQRYAPEILCALSNQLFPEPLGVQQEVLWRRRDCLLECQLKPEIASKFKNIVDDKVKFKAYCADNNIITSYPSYAHLQFRKYFHPSNQNSHHTGWQSYEDIMKVVKSDFIFYRNHQMELYDQKMERYNKEVDILADVPSLKIRMDEFKRSAEFLRTYVPKRSSDWIAFMKIAKEYGTLGELTPIQKQYLIKISNDHVENIALPQVEENVFKACKRNPVTHFPRQPPVFYHNFFDSLESDFYKTTEIIDNFLTYHTLKEYPDFTIKLAIPSYKKIYQYFIGHAMSKEDHTTFRHCEVREGYRIRITNGLNIDVKVDSSEIGIRKVIGIRLICSCKLDLVYCNRRYCWLPLIDTEVLQVYRKSLNGIACLCHNISIGYKFSVQNNAFVHQDSVYCATSCEDKNCMLKEKELRSTLFKHWGKYNPEAVKNKLCPKDLIPLFNITVPDWIKTINSYITSALAATYNFFADYIVHPVAMGIMYITKAMGWIGFAAVCLTFIAGAGAFAMFKANREYNRAEHETFDRMNFIDDSDDDDDENNADPQIISSGDNSQKIIKKHPKTKPAVRKNWINFESGNSNDQIAALKLRLCKNTFIIHTPLGKKLRIVGLHQNVFLFLKHFHECIIEELDRPGWYCVNCFTKQRYNIDIKTWKFSFTENDSVGFARTTGLGQVKSIINRFVHNKDHNKLYADCYIICPTEVDVESVRVKPKLVENVYVSGKQNMQPQELKSSYRYDWSNPGNCGAMLINPHINPSILGIHVAGSNLFGFSEPLSKEDFDSFLPSRPVINMSKVDQTDLEEQKLEGDFIKIGEVDPMFAHHESGESRIKPSLVYNKIFAAKTDIAPLSNHDLRMPPGYSPLYAGVNNKFKTPLDFPTNLLDKAEDYFKTQMLNLNKPVYEPKIRSISTVVDGLPGVKYIDGLEMSTSEGFPLVNIRPPNKHNKSWLFQREGEPIKTVGIDKDLVRLLNTEENLRKSGICVETIFIDCLKDARIKKSKVLTPGKTRIFSISPVQYTIIFKRYFIDFIASYRANRLKLNHAIGINPDGPEWGNLVQFLNTNKLTNKNLPGVFISGDYSNFGPTLNYEILKRVVKIILAWCEQYYQDDGGVVRTCLLYELINPFYLCGSKLYRNFCGAPSGSPCTVEINSMVNDFYIFCAFFELQSANVNSVICAEQFFQKMNYITYGDDIIIKIHEDLKDIINNVELSKFFKKYNIGYTDASKVEVFQPYHQNLDQITFLKRGFLPHPKLENEWLAPLDLDISVKEVCNWISNTHDPLTNTLLSIEGTNSNAYGHGPDIHNFIRQKCYDGVRLLDIDRPFYLRTWEEWDNIHFQTIKNSET